MEEAHMTELKEENILYIIIARFTIIWTYHHIVSYLNIIRFQLGLNLNYRFQDLVCMKTEQFFS